MGNEKLIEVGSRTDHTQSEKLIIIICFTRVHICQAVRMEDMEVSMSDLSVADRRISVEACNVLNELRQAGQLCDAVVKVEDGQFPVHRAIMSACSPYFRALFTNGLHETDQREVVIPGCPADMMNIIIDFAYTRQAAITHENVERLLPAADQFHVMGLLKACCNFLEKRITVDNVLGIRNFARTYFCSGLDKFANKFVLDNFTEVSAKSNEILLLTVPEMCELLSSDELNIKSEERVFEAALRWINHDPPARKKHILELLQCVRLGLLSTQFFVEKVKVHPFISNNEECRPLVIDTLKFLYDLDMETGKEMDLSHPLSRPRVPHEVMFVVGGWSGGSPTNVIETYDTRADRWVLTDSADKGPRAYHGCATVNSKIYVVGGFDGMDYFNSVRSYDPVKKVWEEVAPMNSRRCYVSVAVLDGCIYAMGGFDGHVRQNTAERYTPASNQWSLIAPMNQQRSDANASSLDGHVYIAGGFNGQECLTTAECYNPETNQWTMIAPMRNRRSGVGVVAQDGFLFSIGGFNGISRMNNGEKYNPRTNQWTSIAEMYGPRSNFGIEVIDDMVFAIGGFNGVTTSYNVECYDPSADEWYDCTDMNIYRSALSACVVKGLPNVRDFIHQEREGTKKPTGTSSQQTGAAANTNDNEQGATAAAAANENQAAPQDVAPAPVANTVD